MEQISLLENVKKNFVSAICKLIRKPFSTQIKHVEKWKSIIPNVSWRRLVLDKYG